MDRIKLKSLGNDQPICNEVSWGDLNLDAALQKIVEIVAPRSFPSDIQVKALREGGLLTSRRNLIVAGPTNSGKSLLAYFALVRGAAMGKRVLLLEPLRAIAHEKYDELNTVTSHLFETLGRRIKVQITTGDYRLDEETMQSPPPASGELIIATPERIEAILRNPHNDPWIHSFSVVCIDEAHLLGDPIRGGSLEYVITSFKITPTPPRLILLSATLGDTSKLKSWLHPCDCVNSHVRYPPISREIITVDPKEDPKQVVHALAKEILNSGRNSLLIFVYQTSWAAALASSLNMKLGPLCGLDGAKAYHSRLNAATKAQIRQKFLDDLCRCVVSTSALALGVNLPATHVLVRDLSYLPGNRLSVGSLVQMSGRAGRGQRNGHVLFLLRPSDGVTAVQLKSELEAEMIPEIRSVLGKSNSNGSKLRANQSSEPRLAETLLSLLARRPETGMALEDVETFLANTLGGNDLADSIGDAFSWLAGSPQLLAYKSPPVWKATRLGEAATQASLPLPVAAGTGQLIRDLLSVDSEDRFLSQFTGLDLLVLIELVSDRSLMRKSFTPSLAAQIDQWMDRSTIKSILFKEWIRGDLGFSKACELTGSLGLKLESSLDARDEKPRQRGYLCTWRAIVLWQRAHGVPSADVQRRWSLNNLEDVEERWRDQNLFLLGAMTSLLDVRCFYYHLKESCAANRERIERVKQILRKITVLSLQTMDLVGWCSPLGPIFLNLRRKSKGRGRQLPAQATMQKLEDAGIRSSSALQALSLKQLLEIGVRKDFASAIWAYFDRK